MTRHLLSQPRPLGDRSRMVVFDDITVSMGQLLVMRTGELWAHAMDICLATGRGEVERIPRMRWRERLVLRTACPFQRVQADRMQLAVPVGDQDPSGARIIAGRELCAELRDLDRQEN
jgi:hypothetical protein